MPGERIYDCPFNGSVRVLEATESDPEVRGTGRVGVECVDGQRISGRQRLLSRWPRCYRIAARGDGEW
jgi:hypothetical protein